MVFIVLVLVAIVAFSSHVRGSANRIRAELAARPRWHISIKLAGDGVATRVELHERQSLEQELVRRQIGEVTEAGSGGGYMDVVVSVSDATTAEAKIGEVLAAAGLAARATVKRIA